MALKKLKMEKHYWDPPAKARPDESAQWTSNPFYKLPVWRKKSEQYRREHPLCEKCLAAGRTRPSKVTDHIKPINPVDAFDTQDGKYGDPLDDDNLQALCRQCHGIKSAREKYKRP